MVDVYYLEKAGYRTCMIDQLLKKKTCTFCKEKKEKAIYHN